jgi:hypothetical protein
MYRYVFIWAFDTFWHNPINVHRMVEDQGGDVVEVRHDPRVSALFGQQGPSPAIFI